MAIPQSVRTKILESLVHLLRADPELFDYFGGIAGSGSIEAPESPARIYAFSAGMQTPDLRHDTLIVQHVLGDGSLWEPQVSAIDRPVYAYGIGLIREEIVRDVDFAGVTSVDLLEALVRLIATGHNPKVPGRLRDVDTGDELTTILPRITGMPPVRTSDGLTTYRLIVLYEADLDLRTGANR